MSKALQHVAKTIASREMWKDILMIVAGCSIMSVAFVFFINPYNIVPGGVYGASIVLHNLIPSIKVGTVGYMFDVPLLIISFIALGNKLGGRTIFAALLTPALMNLLTVWAYPPEAVESLAPDQLLGGLLDLSDHLLVSVIIGAVLIGIGSGTIIRGKATSGGTDIVAMIMQKYLGIKFSNSILICDAVVVSSGLFVIGFGIGDTSDPARGILLSMYSIIAVYITSRVVAMVLNGRQQDKMIFVISERDINEMRDFILNDLDRTATCVKASGLYTKQEKEMFFLVVREKEANMVKHRIRDYDPRAFVIIMSAQATYGEGWRALPVKGEVEPE